jgi:hypothetical protein
MAYNHQPVYTEYYPWTMTIRWVPSKFRQELSPALIKRLQNTFLQPIFQGFNQSQSQSHSQPITPPREDWLIASSVITEEKIRRAVNGFGSYSTACEDGIFPGLLQQRIETLVVPLCKTLTSCLAFGYVLKTWQKV